MICYIIHIYTLKKNKRSRHKMCYYQYSSLRCELRIHAWMLLSTHTVSFNLGLSDFSSEPRSVKQDDLTNKRCIPSPSHKVIAYHKDILSLYDRWGSDIWDSYQYPWESRSCTADSIFSCTAPNHVLYRGTVAQLQSSEWEWLQFFTHPGGLDWTVKGSQL